MGLEKLEDHFLIQIFSLINQKGMEFSFHIRETLPQSLLILLKAILIFISLPNLVINGRLKTVDLGQFKLNNPCAQ